MNFDEYFYHNLHLLVDGQLDATTTRALQKKIDSSPELQQELKRIIEIKELLALAYLQEKPAVSDHASPYGSIGVNSFMAIAASLILTVGLLIGWMGHQFYSHDEIMVASNAPPVEVSVPGYHQSLQLGIQDARKYMMHLDSSDDAHLQKALLETSSILHSYAESGLPVKLDVLLNQHAVDLLKPQHVAQIKQIKALINQYDNIQLYACSKSLKLFLKPGEISSDIKLFHSDQVVDELIPKRIKAGWVYIKA